MLTSKHWCKHWWKFCQVFKLKHTYLDLHHHNNTHNSDHCNKKIQMVHEEAEKSFEQHPVNHQLCHATYHPHGSMSEQIVHAERSGKDPLKQQQQEKSN